MSKVKKAYEVGRQKGIRAAAVKLAEDYDMPADELEKELTAKALEEEAALEAAAAEAAAAEGEAAAAPPALA